MEIIKNLIRGNGGSALMVTHDNRILDFADRIINMVDGKIVSNVLIKENISIV